MIASSAPRESTVEHRDRSQPRTQTGAHDVESMSESHAAAVRAAPDPATASKPAKPGALRQFERGLVVYRRCDGLEQQDLRFPCPRDRRLEADVWAVLQNLPQCREAKPGLGQAQLRLEVRRKAAIDIVFERPSGGQSLNLRAVSKCAGPRLAGLHTRLRSRHAVVTFGFGLS
jgi:hypothetical protein